mgnify:CR=1 FL=1
MVMSHGVVHFSVGTWLLTYDQLSLSMITQKSPDSLGTYYMLYTLLHDGSSHGTSCFVA